MASMNTRLNIKKFDGNIVQKDGGSKQVGFKQLGPSVETRVYGVHDEKHVWIEEKEYQTGWKIKTGNVLDSCNQRSTQQCTKSGVAKHLGVAGLQQQNGLVKETNVTLLAKVCFFLIQSGLSKVLWAEDTTMSIYLVNRSPSSAIGFKTPVDMLGFFGWHAIKQGMLEPVVLYRNMGFNESGEYKKTFIGSGVGTGSMQVLQGDEFEVEPQDGHTFEVEPQRNVDHVVGSQEVQTQDLIYYHPARDREQHSVWELFSIEKTVMRLLLQLLQWRRYVCSYFGVSYLSFESVLFLDLV
ncbi:zinc finger, CCHC-type containing protein [Tanacetum coccineum]